MEIRKASITVHFSDAACAALTCYLSHEQSREWTTCRRLHAEEWDQGEQITVVLNETCSCRLVKVRGCINSQCFLVVLRAR